MDTTFIIFVLCISAAASAIVGLVLVGLGPPPKTKPVFAAQELLSEPRTFVFRAGYLVSYSDGAGYLLPRPIDHLTAWSSLLDALEQIVDGAADALEALERDGEACHLKAELGQDELSLVGVLEGDLLRITLTAAEAVQNSVRIDRATLDGLYEEVSNLRDAAETNPALSWCVDNRGRITWANGAYRAVLASRRGEEASLAWPIPALFPSETVASPSAIRRKLSPDGHATSKSSENDQWYELTSCETDSGGQFVHAVAIDKVVQAEDTRRKFIQILTKTFAHLPNGLAIFDQSKRLALFNPVMVDITDLDAAWLSQKPTLEAFFDELRDRQRIPEPKDYRAWRDKLTSLDRANATGSYEETWTIASGQTFRVTGRPYPDGAIALLIEDISSEVGMTRRFNSELELFQSVIDASEEAQIVFTTAGQVAASNAAYASLWDNDPRYTINTSGAKEALSLWQNACKPSPVWRDLQDYLDKSDARAEWVEAISLNTGETLSMRIVPLPSGMTLVGFQYETLSPALPPPKEPRKLEALN